MSAVFKKLNLGTHDTIHVLNSPQAFEPVRMVAIDADWSALRFRRVEHIKSMTRSSKGAISSAGKRKAKSGSKS
jgi:hypothetical protein